MTTLKLTKIPKLNLLVIKQTGGKFFLTSQDSIIIDEAGLLELLKSLAYNDMIDTKHLIDELDFVLEDMYRSSNNDAV